MATTKVVNLADTWLNGQSAAGATYQISDPFSIVTDHRKRPRTDTPGSQDYSPSKKIHTSIYEEDNSHGISSTTVYCVSLTLLEVTPYQSIIVLRTFE